jgi:hypothetical protein
MSRQLERERPPPNLGPVLSLDRDRSLTTSSSTLEADVDFFRSFGRVGLAGFGLRNRAGGGRSLRV